MKAENKNETLEIDLITLFKKLWASKKIICNTCIISLIIGCIIAFSIPKLYKVDVTLSLETGTSENNNLSGMATMLGFGGIGNNNLDALNSTMFPDIIKTTPFILELYNIDIIQKENKQPIKFSEYINQQKKAWWSYITRLPQNIIKLITSIFSPKSETDEVTTINPYRLTAKQKHTIELIKNALNASEDKKTKMTIVSVSLQDPEIAATIADSTISKLQKYITDYKIRKALDDCKYLEKVCQERKKEYLICQEKYANFLDGNRNVILQRTQAEGTRLQNEMSIAFQVYSQVETQLQIAKAKVQEAKPVFAIVEPASVPLKSSSPNKPLIIIALIFLGFISSSVWILFGEDLWNNIRNNN